MILRTYLMILPTIATFAWLATKARITTSQMCPLDQRCAPRHGGRGGKINGPGVQHLPQNPICNFFLNTLSIKYLNLPMLILSKRDNVSTIDHNSYSCLTGLSLLFGTEQCKKISREKSLSAFMEIKSSSYKGHLVLIKVFVISTTSSQLQGSKGVLFTRTRFCVSVWMTPWRKTIFFWTFPGRITPPFLCTILVAFFYIFDNKMS